MKRLSKPFRRISNIIGAISFISALSIASKAELPSSAFGTGFAMLALLGLCIWCWYRGEVIEW